MLYVGDSLSVVAAYEPQNPNQENIATRWSLNGEDITILSFEDAIRIDGREYLRYIITNVGVVGYVYRAVDSYEEHRIASSTCSNRLAHLFLCKLIIYYVVGVNMTMRIIDCHSYLNLL